MVESCEERRDFWTLLRALAGVGEPEVSEAEIETRVRGEVATQIASGLVKLAGGGSAAGMAALLSGAAVAPAAAPAMGAGAAAGDGMAPWIDTDQCTSCDECVNLNGRMFAYNDQKKAYIKDAKAGSFSDLVKAAERCTARVIHPGLPTDRSAKDVDKWIARAEKYN
jgi:pyruvate-ferredoxin/flavodoxin oxidoreductase